MPARKVILLGASRNSLDIAEMLDAINSAPGHQAYECVGLVDDDPTLHGQTIAGLPVLGSLASARDHDGAWFVNGIGSPANFWKKDEIIAAAGINLDRFATLVHPAASVARSAVLGPGTVILPHATVCSHARVGSHAYIGPSAVVSHDSVIGDYTCITAGVSVAGAARVGARCYLGTNSCIREKIRIGDGSLVGMGSVVVSDVAEQTMVFGNPARFRGPVGKERLASHARADAASGLRLAADVRLGERVVMHSFVNLYGCAVGDDTRLGSFVEVQKGALIGARCKISSHTFICEGVTIEDEVFVGHGVMFINDLNPRATTDGRPQTEGDWKVVPTRVCRKASIGSGAVILAGVTIGEDALVGAGAVVTRDVPPGSIVAGVPARVLP